MRFRVHDESLNTYGFWLLTEGGDLTDFMKNPICLWNHVESWRDEKNTILPIGIWKDIKVLSDGSIEMEAEFDEDDDFALKIKKKVDKKMLRATSIGVRIIEWSEDPKYIKPGQLRATAIKWKLREVSIVDIPSNKNAVMLGDTAIHFYDVDGKVMNFSDGDKNVLPLLFDNKEKPVLNMELKEINKSLGLPETANLADVQLKLSSVMAENVSLKAENDAFRKVETDKKAAAIETTLSDAVKAGKIAEPQKAVFRSLLNADFENGNAALQAMNTQVTLSDFSGGANPSGKGGLVRDEKGMLRLNGKTYDELTRSDQGTAILKELKSTDEKSFLEFQQA
jgi:regulator of replication initiation timing